MADNAFVKIGTALLKHQVKKLVGEETLGVISEELADIGGDKLDAWLGDNSTIEELEKAAKIAEACFHDSVGDHELEQWMISLPIGDLPKVLEAIEKLPVSPDEKGLEDAIRESVAGWRKLSPEQTDKAVNSFLSCLRSALLPIEKQTLMVIGRSVLRTEDKVNLLIRWFEDHIIRGVSISDSTDIRSGYNQTNIRDALDLESYIDELNRLFSEANIEKLYVPLDGWLELENDQTARVSLDDYVIKWLEGTKGHLAILGDYGTGKSWFCLKLSKYLLEKYYLDPENNPLPLLITFKRYKSSMDLPELIKTHLFESFGVNIRNSFQLKTILRSGKVLPILDGMDEMAKQVDIKTALVNFSELGMIQEVPKAIVSCRTHYFHSGTEEREIFGSEKKKQLLRDLPHFSIIHVLPFDQYKVLDSISRRFERTKAFEIINFVRNTYNLPELCTRPVLLSMICETYDVLPQLNFSLSSSDLYDTYIDAWLRRELQQGRLTVEPKIIRMIFEDLAEILVAKGTLIVEASVLKAKFENALKFAKFPDELWQAIERQLTTSTFIKRYGTEDWQSAHRSFQEYFMQASFFAGRKRQEGEAHSP